MGLTGDARSPSVVFFAPFGTLNGANRSMLLLAEHLALRAPVSVLALQHDADVEQYARARKIRYRIALAPGALPPAPVRLLRAVRALTSTIAEQRANVVLANTSRALRFAWPAARLCGTRLVCHVRDSFGHRYNDLGLGRIDAGLAPSYFVRDTLPSKLAAITHVIPNPVPLPTQAQMGRKAIAGWTKDWSRRPIDIGVAGLCFPHKGFDLLLSAAPRVLAQFPNLRLHVWGASPEKSDPRFLAQLEEQASKLPIPVAFRPFESDMTPFYQRMDVIVQPSRMDETFGRVAAEALSYATPVVVAHGGSLPELVQEGSTGYHHARGSAPSLAETLVTVLSSPDEAEARGRAGREDMARRCDPSQHAEEVYRALEQLLKGQARPARLSEP